MVNQSSPRARTYYSHLHEKHKYLCNMSPFLHPRGFFWRYYSVAQQSPIAQTVVSSRKLDSYRYGVIYGHLYFGQTGCFGITPAR